MARRIHVSSILVGKNKLAPAQAHHLRDVLRLTEGTSVELFDTAGCVAEGMITQLDADSVTVTIQTILPAPAGSQLIVASAVPKGDRAEWMIEKLSELGTARYIPLQTARSVVHPTGTGKRERWERIATEAARQSRRSGVMQIDDLCPLETLLNALASNPAEQEGNTNLACYLSTADNAVPIARLFERQDDRPNQTITLLIGPEGGWTDGEMARFAECRLTGVKLTGTILRVETAAIAAAAIVSVH